MKRHAHALWFGVALSALASTVPAPVAAQTARAAMGVASARQRSETEAQARQTVQTLFERLCPGRCEVLRVEATMGRPRSITALEPGFEDDAPQAYDAPVETMQVEILIDAALPASFRQNIPRMLRYQLQHLAGTVEVRTESLTFPEPQLEPAPPVVRDPPSYPMPSRMPPAPPAPAEPEAADARSTEEPAAAAEELPAQLWSQAIPWLGGILLALILAALILVMLRRLTRQARGEGDERLPDASSAAARRSSDAHLEQRVREVLEGQRGASNAALRRWLSEDPERVAGLVQIFGVDAVRDLRGSDDLELAFARLGEALISQPELPTGEARRSLLTEAIARLCAAELDQTRGVGWDFLDALSMPQLHRLLETLSAVERPIVLAEMSPQGRTHLLASLSATERSALLLASIDDDDLPLAERRSLRLRVRARAAELQSETGRESSTARVGIDLLRTASADEQVVLARHYAKQHPSRVDALLGHVLFEHALGHLPAGALPDATTTVPLDALVTFLRGTEQHTRDLVVEQLPPRLSPAVISELEAGGGAVSRARYLEARAVVLDSVERVLRRDGVGLAAINARAIGRDGVRDLLQKEAAE